MKNVNQLEREKKEVLLNMTKEELIAYFDNLTKRQYENYPKLTKEGYEYNNLSDFFRIEEIVKDSTKILKEKYPKIEGLPYISKFLELSKLYDENLESGKVLLFKMFLMDILNSVRTIESNLYYLREHLTLYYLRYFNKRNDFIELLKIANVPEETIETVPDSLFNKSNNPKLYETPIEETYNIFIESIVKKLEESIDKFKKYNAVEVDNDKLLAKPDEDPVKEIVESIDYLIIYGNILLDLYEDLKLNPFSEGNKIIIEEYLSLVFEEDIDELDSFKESLTDEKDIKVFNCLKEGFSSNVPKYDFKEFKLIIPEGVESEDE